MTDAQPVVLPKRIGLVAHDNKKVDLTEWASWNRELLVAHDLIATGTTGTLLEEKLGVQITKLRSGPLGGDQQLGALIADGGIDLLVFFWDPLEPQPHDPDVKALLRIAMVWNIPIACNRSSADFMISSPLMASEYERSVPDYEDYIARALPTDALPPDALPTDALPTDALPPDAPAPREPRARAAAGSPARSR